MLRIVFQHGQGEHKALEVFKPQHSARFKMCPRIPPLLLDIGENSS